ncbi:HupE/UreJ family protein [Paraferrimonas sedimenticola]|uniref:HupE / UreJ protein n=1 Tax=Paraferrimonas sedimenticola TaxID=375674 RepID=A0AA37RVK1_9GAMM|nr:HupE/UreJ family protein [Paraferrimonas sedimenticola]GLP96049.1 hypothetical protein GCM10007895_13550 [Paraferrimonas sedimenticola]
MLKPVVQLCLLAMSLVAWPSFAHSPIEGVGEFYNGLLHPLLIPAHVMLLLAVGIWFSQQQKAYLPQAMIAGAVAIVIGLYCSDYVDEKTVEILPLLTAVGVGLLAVCSWRAPKLVVTLVTAFSLLAIGIDSGQAELFGNGKTLSHLGTFLGSLFLLLNFGLLSRRFSQVNWQAIGWRVLASWVTAASFLVSLLQYKGMA